MNKPAKKAPAPRPRYFRRWARAVSYCSKACDKNPRLLVRIDLDLDRGGYTVSHKISPARAPRRRTY